MSNEAEETFANVAGEPGERRDLQSRFSLVVGKDAGVGGSAFGENESERDARKQ